MRKLLQVMHLDTVRGRLILLSVCIVVLALAVTVDAMGVYGAHLPTGTLVSIVVFVFALALGVAIVLVRRILRPLDDLTDAVCRMAEGDFDQALPVARQDEVGELAYAVEALSSRLRATADALEAQVAARTIAWEHQRTGLELATDLAQQAATIHESDTLLRLVVARIAERLNVVYAGIYLLDGARQVAILKAASPGGGEALLARGLRVTVGEPTVVGEVAATGSPCVLLDATTDPRYRAVPELPGIQAAASVPLRARDDVIGVLDVRAHDAAFFSQDDIAYLQALADLVGLAIENARLLGEAEDRLRELSRLVQDERAEGWRQLAMAYQRANPSGRWSYRYDGVEVAAREGADAPVERDLVVPLGEPGAQIGTLSIKAGAERRLTVADVELAHAIADEASRALDRARLQTRRQDALLEADMLYRCSRAIVAAQTADEVLAAIAENAALAENAATAENAAVPGDAAKAAVDAGAVLLRVDLVRAGGAQGPADGGDVRAAMRARLAAYWRRGHGPVATAQAGDETDTPGAVDVPVEGLEIGEVFDVPVLYGLDRDHGDGETLEVPNLGDSHLVDAASREVLVGALGFGSVLAIPLMAGQARLGWLVMGSSRTGYAFSARERRLYRGLAGQAATALRNFQLLALATARAERERSLGEIASRMRETLDMDLILQSALEQIGQTLGISSVEVRMRGGEQ